MKLFEKGEARRMRQKGLAITKIADDLSISKSTVWEWIKDIPLSREQKEKLSTNRNINFINAKRAIRLESEKKENYILGKRMAQKTNPLHLAGCMLYWAEGSKSKTTIQFSNSSSKMVLLFVKFLTDAMNVDLSLLTTHINCYDNNGLSVKEIEHFWQELTGISRKQKTTVNHFPKTSKRKRKNKLIYGVCNIVVYRIKYIQQIYGAIEEYFKIL